MKIILSIEGKELHSFDIPDEYLKNVKGYSWQDNAKSRERTIAYHIRQIKLQKAQLFEKYSVEITLSFESKLNQFTYTDNTSSIFQPIKKAI